MYHLLSLFGVDLRVGRSKAGYEGDLVSELLDAVHDEGRGVIGGLDDAPGQPGALVDQLRRATGYP